MYQESVAYRAQKMSGESLELASVTQVLLDLLHFEVGSNGRWTSDSDVYVSGNGPSAHDSEVLPGILMPRAPKKARKNKTQSEPNIPPSTLRDIRKLCEKTGYVPKASTLLDFVPHTALLILKGIRTHCRSLQRLLHLELKL